MKAESMSWGGGNYFADITLSDESVVSLRDDAEPTSRCMPEPYNSGEEWQAYATYKGEGATVYFYFSEDEIVDEEGDPLLAEHYPWDAEHVLAITYHSGKEIVPSWM